MRGAEVEDLHEVGEGLMFGKGKAKLFDFSKKPRFPDGQMKMMQGELPPGTGPKPSMAPAGSVGGIQAKPELKLQAKPELKLQGPKLSVKTIGVAPAGSGGWIESGKNVWLSIEVANAGPVAAPSSTTGQMSKVFSTALASSDISPS